MPFVLIDDYSPVAESYMLNHNLRGRTWSNTPGFPLADRDNLGVNNYVDDHMWGTAERTPMVKINHSSGLSTTSFLQWPKSVETLRSIANLGLSEDRLDGDLLNEALTKALLKAANVKANLAVMYAEKAKTSQLILNTANRVYKSMVAMKRGRFQEARKHLNLPLGSVHKTQLEISYGWTPLLMEVKGSAEFLAQRFVFPRPARFSVSSKVKSSTLFTAEGLGFNRNGFQSNLERAVYENNREIVCRVKLWLQISNLYSAQLQQLGITNPLAVAWEVTPWSFVFDWLIQVGDYLQAITALHGLTVRKAMYSILTVTKGYTTESFPGYYGAFDNYLPWSNTRVVDGRLYKRNPLSVESVVLRPVVDTSPLSWGRARNAIALLRQNIR